jgi:hypothetical protein
VGKREVEFVRIVQTRLRKKPLSTALPKAKVTLQYAERRVAWHLRLAARLRSFEQRVAIRTGQHGACADPNLLDVRAIVCLALQQGLYCSSVSMVSTKLLAPHCGRVCGLCAVGERQAYSSLHQHIVDKPDKVIDIERFLDNDCTIGLEIGKPWLARKSGHNENGDTIIL